MAANNSTRNSRYESRRQGTRQQILQTTDSSKQQAKIRQEQDRNENQTKQNQNIRDYQIKSEVKLNENSETGAHYNAFYDSQNLDRYLRSDTMITHKYYQYY